LRNDALGSARGDYLTFVATTDTITASDVAAILEAHDQGHALVGIPVGAPTTSAVSVAGRLLTYETLDDSATAVDYLSFAREPLLMIGGFDAEVDLGFEAVAARILIGLGLNATVIETAARRHAVDGGVVGLLRRQFDRGRA